MQQTFNESDETSIITTLCLSVQTKINNPCPLFTWYLCVFVLMSIVASMVSNTLLF